MLARERIELVNKINKAFKNTQVPKGNIGDRDELVGFRGKHWQDVTLDAIEYNDALYFFNAKGFQYYLPAYLVMILKSPDKVTNTIKDGVIRDLGASVHMPMDMCKLFDDKQRKVILEFLLTQSYEEIHGKPDIDPSNVKMTHFVEKQRMDFETMHQRAINYWENC